jgi:ABC-type transport system involved in multi-copper enzyme maturation permease subunit
MTLRNFLMVAAILGFVFGLGFVIMPQVVLGLYGVTVEPAGLFLTQLLGAALLGYGVLNWLASSLNENAPGMRPILLSGLAANGVAAVLSLFAQIGGQTGANALGWSTVVIYLLLALGFAYFAFMRPGR